MFLASYYTITFDYIKYQFRMPYICVIYTITKQKVYGGFVK
jgi:2-oxo-4-hydroxy-4-carboxy--5-ureidoimidazoline (OHCU) decarboxylase